MSEEKKQEEHIGIKYIKTEKFGHVIIEVWKNNEQVSSYREDDHHYANVCKMRAECNHDKDLRLGIITPKYFGSRDYDQDINCSECNEWLYILDSDRQT